ncbi:POT-type proton-dependent oligopeptide transporter [Mucilaginibacter gotjawali]|uniref:Di-/tripeptide transporter n=2 Tax=Mucilaginibacter gotjawali TaxID=1550579 RepID=A0A0X8X276_9SPHI|nr:MFS transporter [Mucilaginibacter gotjawali]MBB3054006.1 POT family proton-dependent oligopeptide transporter [Mucilaginibacter gotjawali]BAU54271.1 Di-/tripeptide transporter [Mucilaginibacter gotjawali]
MSETTLAAEAVPKKSRFPKAVPFIIGNEAAERFSFYGMRSILTLFLVKQFFNPTGSAALSQQADAHANKLNHLFVMVAYALPFVGGMVADWFTGKYKLILYISMVYCLGHLLLSMFDASLGGFEIGMLVVAIGAGGIKSCVSANVGDQFDATNQDLLSKVYGWFYFSINAGSMLSTIIIPTTYRLYGPKLAFGIPGILMALATLIFFMGRKRYVKVPPQGVNRNNLVFITFYALTHMGKRKPGESLLDVAKGPFDPEKVEGMKAVYRVMAVFFFALAFWAVWDQCLSEWTLYAAHSDRNINLGFTSFVIDPGSVSTVNTIFLMIFIVLFNYGIYPFFDKIGLKTTPLRRLGTGLILTALSFVVIGFTHNSIEHGGTPSIWWQVLAFMILSAAEVMVSITGLEYAYTHSPKSMKSTMTGIWFLVVSFGNLITASVNGLIENGGWWAHNLKGANYEWFFVIFIMVFVVAFLIISPRLKERNYITDPYVDNQVIADTNNL